MVITSSASQTKKGKTRRSTSSTRSKKGSINKSGIERDTKPEVPAEHNNQPQNHNALIATSANDTLDNIRVSLDMIREIVCSDNDGMALSEDTKQGLFLHIENLIKALSFLRTL